MRRGLLVGLLLWLSCAPVTVVRQEPWQPPTPQITWDTVDVWGTSWPRVTINY